MGIYILNGRKDKMRKKQIFIFFTIGFLIMFLLFFQKWKENGIVLKINFDQKSYSEGEFICYEIEVENKKNDSIYYQYNSFAIEITSEQGFHVTANGEGNFHQYELSPNGMIIKNMTGYNAYRYLLATGIIDYETVIKVDETDEPVVERLVTNWSTGLTLPAGNYEFHAKFFYYMDEKCKTEPILVECKKRVKVLAGDSEPIEEECIVEDRVTFYAKTEKTIYKTGERLQTWAKYDWLENGWFPWDYYYFCMPVGIQLIHLDTGEETDLYQTGCVLIGMNEPEIYRGAFYMEPKIYSIQEEGNYLIRYHFGYYMEPGGELNWSFLDLPIVVLENENKKEFYSNPSYPVPPVQQIK